MSPKTLAALKKSIAHWEANAAATTPTHVSIGPTACALCGLFFYGKSTCRGCPVYAKTKKTCCRGTPYVKAEDALYDWEQAEIDDEEDVNEEYPAAFRVAAQAEVDFLKSLLPGDVL